MRAISIASLMVVSASAYRVAIMTDMHIDPSYNGTCNIMCYDLGDYDRDPPKSLLTLMLSDLSTNYNRHDEIDAVLVSGDFVVHGLAQKDFRYSNWTLQKPIIQDVIQEISAELPGVPIVSTMGNNDVINHYQAPNGTNHDMFYNDLYKLWFSQNPAMAADP